MTGRLTTSVAVTLLVGLFACSLWADPARALPDGFSDTAVTDVPLPTALGFTPDGRMLVTSKPGRVYSYQNGQRRQILDLAPETCDNSERGLLGVAVDPRFGTAGHDFVYLYYTKRTNGECSTSPGPPTNPVNRVSRFVVGDDGTIDKGTEKVLLNNIMSTKGNHNAGDLHFGKDGNLYVSVGDGGCDYAEPTRCQYENDSSRDKNILNGKILRIKPDGAIPADNPFTGPDSARCNLKGKTERGKNCQETYLKGFRNPFRFAVDPDAAGTVLRVNDVGGQRWEEIDGARVADAGNDYGWNICEGRHDNRERTGRTDCDGAALTGPIHEYNHDTGCESVTGGAFVPDGAWRASDDEAYLFGDYVCGKIFRLMPDGTKTELASGLGRGGPVALEFGPYETTGKALFYTTFASPEGGQVRRIAHTAGNLAPIAEANANPPHAEFERDLTIDFDGSGSSDPDGDAPLAYEWDFQSDGTVDSTEASPQHAYAQRGKYTATLTVTDAEGKASEADRISVFPGNRPPEPTVQGPADGSQFVVDESLRATGSATDSDEGDAIRDLSWQVLQHHDGNHTHPLASGTGDTLTFDAPAPEGLYSTDPGENYLEVRLTATDSLGLSKTTNIELRPDAVDLTFETRPVPLRLKVNGRTFRAPRPLLSWVGYDLNVAAPRQRDAEGRLWVFDSWSDGRAGSHTIDSPADPEAFTATFRRARR